MMNPGPTTSVAAAGASGVASSPQTTNLGDILERVLDRGLVITGDIRVSLLDIELITIKLRLLIASVDTARSIGINWWENDPWLTANRDDDDLREENRRLRERVEALESGEGAPALEQRDDALEQGDDVDEDESEREESRSARPRRRSR